MIRMSTVTTAVLPAALLLPAPATAEVVASTETDFTSRQQAEVPASPFAVWAALIAPAKWWDSAHTWSGSAANLYIDSQATGCFCELLPVDPAAPEGTRRGSVEHMHIIAARPGKMLRMTGGLGPLQADPVRALLTVTLDPAGTGTRITFEYQVAGLAPGQPAALSAPVDGVLGEQIGRLAAILAKPAAPEPATPPQGK